MSLPPNPLALQQALQRAVAAIQQGRSGEAERLCRQVLAANARQFDALYLMGVLAGQAAKPSEAADFLGRALAVNPQSADACYNRGVALGELRHPAEALECYERAIALKPDHGDAHFNRGVVLDALDRPAEAVTSYERAIALNPGSAEAYNNRGIALARLSRHAEALTSYERAIALRPDNASLYNNRGNALAALGQRDEALASFAHAIALRPGYAEAYDSRGLVQSDLERHAEALASFERAIALKPDYAEAYYDRGNALRELHRHAEAVQSYERAIALKPDYASAHWNLADCHLLLGDFARGWNEYEWRWKLPQRQAERREFNEPLWLGASPVSGQTMLLHSEMGLGDTLLFCRYASKVAALGAKVVLEVQPPLLELLRSLDGVDAILPAGAPLPAFDCHCPLMSLPLAFKTDLDSVPAGVPYIRSDRARVEAWRARLGEGSAPRVGLVWSGSTALRNDQRSMALSEMLPLVRAGTRWVSLQKEIRDTEAALLASRADILHFGGELRDFADTAALVELMDVVVTIDTSVANLGGAMGKTVWILLPFNPHDWRWMLDRDDSIWYPTARLFRQSATGDWAGVIRRVDVELGRMFHRGD